MKPYVRRNKNDGGRRGGDLRGGAGRPGQRFVLVRSIDNQAHLMRHRARELLARPAHGGAQCFARPSGRDRRLIAPQGAHHAYGLKRMAVDGFNENGEIVVPDCVRGALRSLRRPNPDALDEAIGAIDKGACGRRSRRTRRPSG